jgi:predicted transcriptional regulator
MAKQPLTTGELEVMQALWKHGEMKPGEIQERFSRPILNAALRSALLVLLKKGHVTRRREGRAYYYSAKTPREGGLKKIARRLAEVFAGGSTAGLIAQLIETEKLSAEDVAALRRAMEEKSGDRKPSIKA